MRKNAISNNKQPTRSLDAIDRKLLNALQRNAEKPNLELAKEVGLSPAPCSRRVKRLWEEGIIERQVVIVDPSRLGIGLTAFIGVELNRQRGDVLGAFEKRMATLKEVQQCYFISGESDYLLVVTCRDMAAFNQFIRTTLSREPAVTRFRTSFVADRIKCDTAIHFEEG